MKEFIEAPRRIYEEAKKDGRLIEGLSLEELKLFTLKQEGVVTTGMGSVAAYSDPMSRAAAKTKNSIDHEFGEEERQLANQAIEILRKYKVVSLDFPVGKTDEITGRLLVSEDYSQLAYATRLLFGEGSERIVEYPTYQIVLFTDNNFERNKKIKDVREKDVTIRLWMEKDRREQVKIGRNTTYFGEVKKGVFTFEDWRVKAIDKEGIFLHAGVRRDKLWTYNYKTKKPELEEKITAISGLTATGKTSLLCRKSGRMPREKSEMVGEDGGTFRFDGSFCAFEKSGVYAKTDSIDRVHPEILSASLAEEAYLENVSLRQYPYIPNFSNVSLTKNSRAVVLRENLGIASEEIDVDRIDNIALLTRNPLINAISWLKTPEQATMQEIYGESIQSSGGVEVEAGKPIREFFLDPFVVGDRLEHAMIFYDFLKKNDHINCYLLNTGTIGQDGIDITLRDTLAILNDLLRERMKFSPNPDSLGYFYPIKCDRANLDKLTASDNFEPEVYEKRIKEFLTGRQLYLEEFKSKWGEIPENIKESLRYE